MDTEETFRRKKCKQFLDPRNSGFIAQQKSPFTLTGSNSVSTIPPIYFNYSYILQSGYRREFKYAYPLGD